MDHWISVGMVSLSLSLYVSLRNILHATHIPTQKQTLLPQSGFRLQIVFCGSNSIRFGLVSCYYCSCHSKRIECWTDECWLRSVHLEAEMCKLTWNAKEEKYQ